MGDDEPFNLTEPSRRRKREAAVRQGQQRFKFRVLRRYGPQCAFCNISAPELLDAAHLRPKEYHGSDDPRNGLMLCASHHRALDAGLLAIEPGTVKLCFHPVGPDARGRARTLYSLRHTALMFRLLKYDNVGNFLLAQNALTSVDQLERFYLSHAESRMRIENLQSFGS